MFQTKKIQNLMNESNIMNYNKIKILNTLHVSSSSNPMAYTIRKKIQQLHQISNNITTRLFFPPIAI